MDNATLTNIITASVGAVLLLLVSALAYFLKREIEEGIKKIESYKDKSLENHQLILTKLELYGQDMHDMSKIITVLQMQANSDGKSIEELFNHQDLFLKKINDTDIEIAKIQTRMENKHS